MREVIYLEPDEEITSIIDKIKAVDKVADIILVAPKSASLIQSVVNLKLLNKEAKNLAKKIAIVTDDEIGRNLASQVGLTVYQTIDSDKPLVEAAKEEPNLNETIEIDMSEKSVEPPPGVKVNYYDKDDLKTQSPKKEKSVPKTEPKTHSSVSPISVDKFKAPKVSKPKKPKKMLKIVLISLAVLLLGSLLFYYFYPKATITLNVKAESIEENIKIVADTSIDQASSEGNAIPGEIISVNSEISENIQATGEKDVGQKSTGTVTVSNGTGNKVDIPSGTQLQSNSGLYFVTTSAVSVPAATASVDGEGNVIKNPGSADVSVEAKESGDQYNIGPTGFSIINYPNVSASNANSFSGGTSEKVKIVSQDDVDNAYNQLAENLQQQLKESLSKDALDKKLSIISTAIEYVDENYSTSIEAGSEADNFDAKLYLNAKTIAFNEENYKNIVVAAIGDKVPEDKELVLSADDEISQGDYEIDFSSGILTIEGTIKTKIAPKINQDEIIKQIKGKNISQAESIIQDDKTKIKDVQIDIRPRWIGRIPSLTKAIEIQKNYDIQ